MKIYMRLDRYISETFHFSRNKAQQIIASNLVTINNRVISKSSYIISADDCIKISEDRRLYWVSRSAEKLFSFLENPEFSHIKEKILNATCLDIGASTGGFSQVLLHFWAKSIDSVDVGDNQLHETLRQNPKIHSFENTDIRNFSSQKNYEIIVCDASFISLEKIFDAIISFANISTEIILLFKPQFEVGKNYITKSWVPKNEKIIFSARQKFETFVQEKNCRIISCQKSTLLGESWNQEFIYYLQKNF